MPQVLCKDTDGLFVGFLLAESRELCFDGRFKQSLIAILDSFGHQFATRCVAIDVMPFQPFYSLFVIRRNTDTEDAFALPSTHGQETVGGTTLERFFPVEVVTIFLCLVTISLGLHDFRGDESLAPEGIAKLLATALILADDFSDDILSPLDGFVN